MKAMLDAAFETHEITGVHSRCAGKMFFGDSSLGQADSVAMIRRTVPDTIRKKSFS